MAFSLQGQTAGTLTVSATTSATASAEYVTKNVVAIWVEDANNKFVKSLLVMANVRKGDLFNWAASTNRSVVDAVTGATLANYGVQNCTWNGTDVNKAIVTDGNYTLKMELSDNRQGVNNLASFTFAKGATKQTLTPATQSGFSAVSIVWTPAGTDVTNPDYSVLYNVYPSITRSNVFVDGADVESVDVLSASGGFIFKSKVQEVNLSSLPSGVYLLSINTARGTLVKRVVKE